MFQSWRLQLRKAADALGGGRLDEAGQLLREEDLRRFRPGAALAARVASQMAKRGRKQVEQGDSRAGWHDLDQATILSPDATELPALRQALLEGTVEEAESCLEAADAEAALARLRVLEKRGLDSPRARTLKQAAQRWRAAENYQRQGEFAQADIELATACALLPESKRLAEQRKNCREALLTSRPWLEKLHNALAQESWTDVLSAAEKLLELAPEHAPSLDARRRAWSAVGIQAGRSAPPPRQPRSPAMTNMSSTPVAQVAPSGQRGPRFLLWVDAVGGFLVCQGSEILIGQPIPGNDVDIPVLADVSRKHAVIRRDGEGYTIQPLGKVRVDGVVIQRPSLLRDGSQIEMGDGVVWKFSRPHMLSASARLDFVSRHRTKPSVDGILLMAETCILGPRSADHIVCPSWPEDVVLFRRGETLACRSKLPLEVDQRAMEGSAELTHQSRVQGEALSFSLEPI